MNYNQMIHQLLADQVKLAQLVERRIMSVLLTGDSPLPAITYTKRIVPAKRKDELSANCETIELEAFAIGKSAQEVQEVATELKLSLGKVSNHTVFGAKIISSEFVSQDHEFCIDDTDNRGVMIVCIPMAFNLTLDLGLWSQ